MPARQEVTEFVCAWRTRLSFGETLVAATAAALPASFLTTPADVIKTKMQAAAGFGAKLSIPRVAAEIYKTEGLAGFFVGAPIRVGLKAPTLGVALFVVEMLTQLAHGGFRLPLSPVPVALSPAPSLPASGTGTSPTASASFQPRN